MWVFYCTHISIRALLEFEHVQTQGVWIKITISLTIISMIPVVL